MIIMNKNDKSSIAPLINTRFDHAEPAKNIEDPIIDYSLRVIKGIYKGKFLYINLTPEGESFGSDPNADLTMYIENGGLSPKHAEIKYKDKHYFLRDLDSKTGTWVQVRQDNPIEIYEDMEIKVDTEHYVFNFAENINDEISAWLDRLGLMSIRMKLDKKYECIQDIRNINEQEISNIGLHEDELIRFKEAIKNINIDFAYNYITRKVKLTNVERKQTKQIGWSGAMIRTKNGLKILENYASYGIDENDSEFIIKYQYGRYWLVLPDAHNHIYFRIPKTMPYILVPDDVIIMGDIHFLVQRYNTGTYEHKGTRNEMEDMSVIRHDLWVSDRANVSLYAIFDGHGGTECCKFLADNFVMNFRNFLLKTEIPFDDQLDFYRFMNDIIIKTAQETDMQFYNTNKEIALGAGSAAIIVIIIGDRIFCANVGDSRAILSRTGKAINLSKDHKPDNYEESKRIEEAGGFVHATRVMSKLGISRAFGDFEYKTISQSETIKNLKKGNDGKDLVLAIPEIRETRIDYLHDEFIIIGCDGLFDVYSSQECVNFVREKLSEMNFMEQDPNKVAKELVNKAVNLSIKKARNSDNVTVIIICLTRGILPNLDR